MSPNWTGSSSQSHGSQMSHVPGGGPSIIKLPQHGHANRLSGSTTADRTMRPQQVDGRWGLRKLPGARDHFDEGSGGHVHDPCLPLAQQVRMFRPRRIHFQASISRAKRLRHSSQKKSSARGRYVDRYCPPKLAAHVFSIHAQAQKNTATTAHQSDTILNTACQPPVSFTFGIQSRSVARRWWPKSGRYSYIDPGGSSWTSMSGIALGADLNIDRKRSYALPTGSGRRNCSRGRAGRAGFPALLNGIGCSEVPPTANVNLR
jgi:hypothetical protein